MSGDSEEAAKEPWEVERKEGFDVFNYDAERARRGQRLVIAIFVIAAALIAYRFTRVYIDPVFARFFRG